VVHARDAGALQRGHRAWPADLVLPQLCVRQLGRIVGTWNENVWLASKGGGIGTYWGEVRGIGEPVGLNGKTSGIIPSSG
jgi:ribonucleoside-diphosphate reductase alpha chain